MSSQKPFVVQSDRIKALCEEAMRRPDISITEKSFEIRFERPSTDTARLRIAPMMAAAGADGPSARSGAGDESRPGRPEAEPAACWGFR